jgi:sec-independent protein translocase protein TatA
VWHRCNYNSVILAERTSVRKGEIHEIVSGTCYRRDRVAARTLIVTSGVPRRDAHRTRRSTLLGMLANIAGLPDIGIVVVLVVILFGGSQLPKIARNIGMAGKEFRKAHDEAAKEDPPSPIATTNPAPPMVAPVPPMVAAVPGDDRITLSKTELEALLNERESRAKGQATS